MAKLLKLRRGTTTQHSSFTGAEGECTVDTTKDTLVVHDGSTAGGRALLREDLNNLAAGAIAHAKLANDCIDGDNLQDNAVDSEHYTDGSIDHEHLANDCIDGDNIQDDVINSEHYAAGSIDEEHIADNQVTLDKMAGIARGKIIYGDSSGNPAVLAPGSADQVLTSDGTDISWATAGGGSTGGGSEQIFHLSEKEMNTSYTIAGSGAKNAGVFGPLSIASGATLTIPSGSTLSIV